MEGEIRIPHTLRTWLEERPKWGFYVSFDRGQWLAAITNKEDANIRVFSGKAPNLTGALEQLIRQLPVV